MTVAFDAGGTPRLSGDDAVGQVLAIVAVAAADGTWERLKACPADDCHWAFYDFSRNHSRTWCTMSTCGNRAKARTYRARQPKAVGVAEAAADLRRVGGQRERHPGLGRRLVAAT